MNVLWILTISAVMLFLGYRFYSRYISRILGEDPKRVTPSVQFNDGLDYVPTKGAVVFAHHFASIAGAGPILGPTLAIMYGMVPVWAWIIIGGIFIGAVHDYTALFISMREKGKSIAEIARKSLGDSGFALMIVFTILMVVLVTSSFLVASATSLTSLVSLDQLRLPLDQKILHTATIDGICKGKIGGIASTSVIFITLFAPIIGFLYYKKNISLKLIYPLAIIICVLSVAAGLKWPVSLDVNVWMIVLGIYTLFAAGAPVWVLLQPRDFINVFILYGGIILLICGSIGAGLSGVQVNAPAFNITDASAKLGLIWPFLFITVACGAISGFHALVAGGTVSKQVTNEKSARSIGFGGMLLESLLAVGVIIALGSGISFNDYTSIVFPAQGKSNPILAFSLAFSGLLYKGLHVPMVYGTIFGILMVEGFVATTLDTAVRINRYLFEELWSILFKNPPIWIKSYLFNSLLSVILMLFFAFTNAFTVIWPVFGTANQLLAALTLVTLAVWLAANRKKNGFVIVPAIFMIVTTIFSLGFLLKKYFIAHNYLLLIVDIMMIALTLGFIVVALNFKKRKSVQKPDESDNKVGIKENEEVMCN
ncbi:MAG TPA: carbon starvation CstA family protein [Chitinispirillaceae bacterium]|nr:carbon starvation CstA family protein [Chitinispirillaceae bacterium]